MTEKLLELDLVMNLKGEDPVEEHESNPAVKQVLELLPKLEREFIILRFGLDGVKYTKRELTSILNVGNIDDLQNRVMKRLRSPVLTRKLREVRR